MGWDENQTLDSDMNAIIVGYDGLMNKLKLCYGLKEDDRNVASGNDMAAKARELNTTKPRARKPA